MSKALVWMRDEVSKWLMRTQNAGRLLNIPLRATTASSVLTLALQKTFLAQYTMYVLVFFAVGIGVFIWAYDRFEVMNRQSRWDADRSDNFTGPTTAINQEIGAEQQAKNIELWSRVMNGEDIEYEEALDELMPVTREAIKKRRNGVEVDNYET